MKKILPLLLFVFSGCVLHWIAGTETRVQLRNETPWAVRDFRVAVENFPDDGFLLIAQKLGSGERSKVNTVAHVGRFFMAVDIDTCSVVSDESCWVKHFLGKHELGGNSSFFVLEELDSVPVLR